MKIENSLDYFKSRKEMHLSDICQQHEDNAVAALEKQIPKKTKPFHGPNSGLCKCPICKMTLCTCTPDENLNYCPGCGQALKW